MEKLDESSVLAVWLVVWVGGPAFKTSIKLREIPPRLQNPSDQGDGWDIMATFWECRPKLTRGWIFSQQETRDSAQYFPRVTIHPRMNLYIDQCTLYCIINVLSRWLLMLIRYQRIALGS